ncbi:hypothetical protein KY289_030371 [Solanum tuberosum]|nr:hypothetical protein KY289_030371 [Solanum tuberosum]
MAAGQSWLSRLLALLFSHPRRKIERDDTGWSLLFPLVEPAGGIGQSNWSCGYWRFPRWLLLDALPRRALLAAAAVGIVRQSEWKSGREEERGRRRLRWEERVKKGREEGRGGNAWSLPATASHRNEKEWRGEGCGRFKEKEEE